MRTRNNTVIITGADLSPGHEYDVVVQAVSTDGRVQSPDDSPRQVIVIKGKETTPSQPTGLSALGGIVKIALAWDAPTDKDFDVMEVWKANTNSLSLATKIALTNATTWTDEIGSTGLMRYYWIRARNTSGKLSPYYPEVGGVSATTSGIDATDIADFAVTATKVFANTVVLTGDAWENNQPGAGSIRWNTHYLVYGGAYYQIAGSNTALRFVYWEPMPSGGSGTVADPYITAYLKSATYAHGANRFMVATNEAGVAQLVWNASANMVIGSAFIMNAAIVEAKIDNLAVTQGKIGLLAVGTAQIDNLAVTNAKIDTLAVSKLTAGTISSKSIVLGITAGTGDCAIRAGKTDFTNAETGFILGLDDSDSDKPKFYIGNTTNYLNWTGAALNIAGVITVTAGSNVEAGADVTSTHTAANIAGQGALAVLSVIGNAYITDLAVSKLTAGTISSKSIVLAVAAGTGDVEIRAGIATGDFANAGAASGFIIGLDDSDSDKPKAYIGGAANYVKWDGAALTVRGVLTANDITAGGTITGSTVQTAAAVAGHGQRIVLSQADNTLRFHTDTIEDVIIIDDDATYAGSPLMEMEFGGQILIYRDTDNAINITNFPTVGAHVETCGIEIHSEARTVLNPSILTAWDTSAAGSATIFAVLADIEAGAGFDNKKLLVVGTGGLWCKHAIQSAGAITAGTGLTVTTGNIVLSGAGATVDGVDVSAHAGAGGAVHADVIAAGADGFMTGADKTKLNGLVTNATHTGEVTGSGALTIATGVVTLAKMANIASGYIIGRNTAGIGVPEALSAGTVRGLINVENGATADQTANEILAALLTVDGVGSLLDADKLDGLSSADFFTAANHAADPHTMTIDGIDVSAHAADTTTAHGAVETNTANKIVIRGSTGNFAANIIYAAAYRDGGANQVVGTRVVDARCDDAISTIQWTEQNAGVLDAVRDAVIAHGLLAAS